MSWLSFFNRERLFLRDGCRNDLRFLERHLNKQTLREMLFSSIQVSRNEKLKWNFLHSCCNLDFTGFWKLWCRVDVSFIAILF